MAEKNPVAREVKILDAVVKEDEGTDEEPAAVQYIWLQLQDVKTNRVYTTTLSLQDIKEITGMNRLLQGRELINFALNLRNRDTPLMLVFNPNEDEITPETIMNEEGI